MFLGLRQNGKAVITFNNVSITVNKGTIDLSKYDITTADASFNKKSVSLQSSTSADSLLGGNAGDDIYTASDGTDVIADYESNDILQIFDKRGKASKLKNSVFSNNELTLTINGGGKVLLKNVSSETAFNINNETYRIRGNSLIQR